MFLQQLKLHHLYSQEFISFILNRFSCRFRLFKYLQVTFWKIFSHCFCYWFKTVSRIRMKTSLSCFFCERTLSFWFLVLQVILKHLTLLVLLIITLFRIIKKFCLFFIFHICSLASVTITSVFTSTFLLTFFKINVRKSVFFCFCFSFFHVLLKRSLKS